MEKKMNLEELVLAVEKWGTDRKFYDPKHGTTASKQFLKLTEEIGEIAGNLARGKCVKDDIGDSIVVLIGLAKLSGTNIKECLQVAYDDIKDRKGEMVSGVFVKQSDLI